MPAMVGWFEFISSSWQCFLVADTQLCTLLCQSVSQSVCQYTVLLLNVVVPLLPLPSRTHRKVRRCQTWFYPLWPYFGLFLAVSCPKIVRIFAGQHILLTVCRHQVDTPEKLSQAMIIYSKMQFLFILTQFWPVLGHFWPRYFEKYYWTACFAQMLSGSAQTGQKN